MALALPALAHRPIQPVPPPLLRTLAPSIAPTSSPLLPTDTAPDRHPAVSGRSSASSPPEDRQTRPPATAKPQPARVITGRSVEGKASWYCVPGRSRCPTFAHGGLFAAAGPALRVGDWRGRYVTVWYGKAHVTVRLVDECGRGCTVAIDLFGDVFAQLAPLDTGRINVRVTW